MTWQELLESIQKMNPRFLDTTVQIFDVANGITSIDGMLVEVADENDYLIDKDQPQIWTNFEEFNMD